MCTATGSARLPGDITWDEEHIDTLRYVHLVHAGDTVKLGIQMPLSIQNESVAWWNCSAYVRAFVSFNSVSSGSLDWED